MTFNDYIYETIFLTKNKSFYYKFLTSFVVHLEFIEQKNGCAFLLKSSDHPTS